MIAPAAMKAPAKQMPNVWTVAPPMCSSGCTAARAYVLAGEHEHAPAPDREGIAVLVEHLHLREACLVQHPRELRGSGLCERELEPAHLAVAHHDPLRVRAPGGRVVRDLVDQQVIAALAEPNGVAARRQIGDQQLAV